MPKGNQMDTKALEFKGATLENLDNIARLHAKSWQENYHQVLSADYLQDKVFNERTLIWSKRLAEPKSNQYVIIALVNGNFAGFISIFGANHQEYGTIIDNLHVASDFKGYGLGTRLLNLAAKWAGQHYKNDAVYLEVLACNTNAIGFYTSLGGKNVASGIWHTPCDNHTKEYIYSWPSAQALSKQTEGGLRVIEG